LRAQVAYRKTSRFNTHAHKTFAVLPKPQKKNKQIQKSGVYHNHPVTWEINPKKWQVTSPLVIQGFSNFFRVVSNDYGKLWFLMKWCTYLCRKLKGENLLVIVYFITGNYGAQGFKETPNVPVEHTHRHPQTPKWKEFLYKVLVGDLGVGKFFEKVQGGPLITSSM